MEDNNLQQTNTFEGGMNTDLSDMHIKNNEYRYAENIRIVTNTDSNTGEARLIEGASEIQLYLDGNLFYLNRDEHIFAFTECDGYNIMFTKESYNKGAKNLQRSIDTIINGQSDNYIIKATFEPELFTNGAYFQLESQKAGVDILPETVDMKLKCDVYLTQEDYAHDMVTPAFVYIRLTQGQIGIDQTKLEYFYDDLFETLYDYCNIKEIHDAIIISENTQYNYKLKFYKREDSSITTNDILLYEGSINPPVDPGDGDQDTEFDGYVWNVYRIEYPDNYDDGATMHKIFGPCKTKMWDGDNDYELSFEYFLDRVKQLYFVDGHHLLMKLDIMNYNGSDIKSIQQYNYSGVLYAPEVDLNLQGGSLKAGVVQYSYQCYNAGKTATNVSPISGPLEIYDTSKQYFTEGQITSGNAEDYITSASVNIKINVKDVQYDNILLYRIQYIQNGQPPLVDLIYDGTITKNGSFFNYVDTGNKITSYNLEYLQSKISNFSLIPKLICSKNNYLFASNVKVAQDDLYLDWNATENVKISLTYRSDGDCIISKISDYGTLTYQENLARYKSLKDGETYRYGIILYSNDGLISATKWVADVTPERAYNYSDVESNMFYEKTTSGGYKSVMAKPIGIHVEVKDLPKGCIGYEIVRCVRTLNDTRCIAQGVLSNTLVTNSKINKLTEARFSQQPFISMTHNRYGRMNIVNINEGKVQLGDSWITKYKPRIAFTTTAYASQNLMQFISPEVSYNGEQISNIIKNSTTFLKIKRVYSSNTQLNGRLTFCHRSDGGDKYYRMDARSFNSTGKYPFLWYDVFTYEKAYTKDDGQVGDYSDSQGNGCCYYINNTIDTAPQTNYNDYAQITPEGLNVSYIENWNAAGGWDDAGYSFAHLQKLYYDVSKNDFRTTSSQDSDKDVFYIQLMPSLSGVAENDICRNKTIQINDAELIQTYDMRELFRDDTDVAQDRLHDISVSNYTYSPLVLCGIDIVNVDNKRHIDILKNNWDVNKYGTFGNVLGLGCPGLILNLDYSFGSNASRIFGDLYSSTTSTPMCSSVTYVCNLEKECVPYGGSQNVDSSVYVSTGNFFNSGQKNVDIFDGDTYLQMYEHCNCHQYYSVGRNQMNKYMIYYHIPLETDINLALTHGEKISRDCIEGKYKYQYIQLRPNEVKDDDGTFVQSEPMYQYNFVYSTKQSSIKSSGIDTKSAQYGSKFYGNRIYYSNQKISNSTEDEWQQFKSANFLDVDNKYGEVTGLHNFNNNLYFWQENAFGVLSVNEKQMISDSNGLPLLLGTGDVLQRYDYLSYLFGMKKGSDTKIQGNQILYWFDIDRKSLLQFNGSNVQNLFEIKNIQNLVNNTDFTNYIQKCIYDLKNKELMLNGFGNKTLTFNEKIDNFTSVYNLYFRFGTRINENLFLTSYRKIYEWNSNRNSTHSRSFKFKKQDNDVVLNIYPSIKYIVNKFPQLTKVYDNLLFDVTDLNVTITDGLGNEYRPIDEIDKTLKFNFDTVTGSGSSKDGDITDREFDYKMAIPRSNNADYGSRLRGKIMKCEVKCNYNVSYFSLRYITTKYRISWN